MDDTQTAPVAPDLTEVTRPEKDPLGGPIQWKEYMPQQAPFPDFSKEITLPSGTSVFIRLPNQYQHRDVQRRARAARARRVMQFKDPQSDSSLIVEEECAKFDDLPDSMVVKWLVDRQSSEAIFQAQIDLDNEKVGEAPDEKSKWPDIDVQLQRYHELLRREESEGDEFRVLEAFLQEYASALEQRVEFHLEPIRTAYEAMDRTDLIGKVRRAIIKADCDDEYLNVYNQWQIFYGTRKLNNHEATHFKSFDVYVDERGPDIDMLVTEFSKLDALKAGDLRDFLQATSS